VGRHTEENAGMKNFPNSSHISGGSAFGVRLQEHRQEITQWDARAYTRSTSKSAATESAVTDHAISLNHAIDWDRAKVIDRESNRTDLWIREAIHIRKEQDKSMNQDDGPTNFHTSMITYCTPQRHLVDSHSDEGSSGCRNVNINNENKGCILMNCQLIKEMTYM